MNTGCCHGIYTKTAKVELIDVAVKAKKGAALYVPHTNSETIVVATRCEFANSFSGAIIQGAGTSATFNNCVFHDNEDDGLSARYDSTVHLHGEATAVHSNGIGIIAYRSGTVLIHLPSNHNTSYNNRQEDRRTYAPRDTIDNVED